MRSCGSRRAEGSLRRTTLVLAIGLVCGGCGSEAPSQPSPPPPPPVSSFTVSSITDGDTLRFSPPLEGTSILRLLDVDTAETTQVPWGDLARAELLRLAPPQTELRLETEQMHIDPFGRLLAHAIRLDGLDVNKELLRLGQAVLFVIWPNVGRFEEYRAAEIEAQAEGRGVWNPTNPLTELPFEYRLRIDRDTPFRPVGDFFTRRYVEPSDYRRVDLNNRVFFNNSTDAASAGYSPCPRTGTGDYSPTCFASGR